jgi:DNA-binding NarL/FixJ family response regulator
MAGGTLVVTREVKNHLYYKRRLEGVGFPNVTPTALEKDALNFQIYDLKPSLVIIDAMFYECCTPFLVGELKRFFPKIKMAAVSIGTYPPELAMYFIINGAYSYVSTSDGLDNFFDILADIGRGKICISPLVEEHIASRREYPMPAKKIIGKKREILKLTCCGYKELEIADTLSLSKKTVDNYRRQVYTNLNVRNPIELVIAALTLKLVNLNELYFRHKNFTVNPQPD